MPYRIALPAPPSLEPTFGSLLRTAWRKTWIGWVLAAVLLAGGLVGWEVYPRRLHVFPFVLALVVCRIAIDTMFDQWASWVPNLEEVRGRSTSVVALLGAGVISVSLALAPVLGRLYEATGRSPLGPILTTERVTVHLVVATVTFVCFTLPSVLRLRLPRE